MMSKSINDFTCAYLLTSRNEIFLQEFIQLVFDHMEKGVDQHTKKFISVVLRALQIGFNDIKHENIKFLIKKGPPADQVQFLFQKFGSGSLRTQNQNHMNQLQVFNQMLLQTSSEKIFLHNATSFDGSAMLKKCSEY